MIIILGAILGIQDDNRTAFNQAKQNLLDLDPSTITKLDLMSGVGQDDHKALSLKTESTIYSDITYAVIIPGWENDHWAYDDVLACHTKGIKVIELSMSLTIEGGKEIKPCLT